MKNKIAILLYAATILLGGCSQANQEESTIEVNSEVVESQEVTTEELETAGETLEAEETDQITPEAEEAAEASLDDSIYVGEYLDYDNNEPNLEIAKGDDGKYIVQIGIYRLTTLEDGVGELTEEGMLFTATDAAGNPISGVITVEDKTATVTFTNSTWDYLENGTSFQYTKSSDVPNVWR